MTVPRTLYDKIWAKHAIVSREDGATLLWVDRHLVHEGSHHAFAKLAARDLNVAEPELTVAVADHYAPTRAGGGNRSSADMLLRLEQNASRHGIRHFGMSHQSRGIVHVLGPEQGLTLPGLVVCCGDSHTSTHGALGALGFGIGATEVAHVLATQTVWQEKAKTMRITISGQLGVAVTAKDLALHWIARLGADGARGHVIEYAGPVVRALSVEGRMTLCNLSIEGGARAGMVAPDAVTLTYIHGRAEAPRDADWDQAAQQWLGLVSDAGAVFDREVSIDAADVAPTITWGTSPEAALPIDGTVPDPTRADVDRAEAIRAALDYMGLKPGRPLQGTPVDRVFLGSCTNGRIEDLRAAAAVLKGRKAKVPGMVVPGSMPVKVQAEQEGLHSIFIDAGLEWTDAGCSMCVAMNGDHGVPGDRCASSTNRNFRGRQGQGVRTHLMSPAMVAAAAVTGTLTDVRPLLEGRA